MAEFPKKIWLIGTDAVGLDAVWCDCPDPAPGIDEQGVIGPYVLGADDEITRLRQRVAELESKMRGYEQEILIISRRLYVRGERMKEINKALRMWTVRRTAFEGWFDPETGEPL